MNCSLSGSYARILQKKIGYDYKHIYMITTHDCSFVYGLYDAMAVSVIGANTIDLSLAVTASPIPWDDFFPTSFTGNS